MLLFVLLGTCTSQHLAFWWLQPVTAGKDTTFQDAMLHLLNNNQLLGCDLEEVRSQLPSSFNFPTPLNTTQYFHLILKTFTRDWVLQRVMSLRSFSSLISFCKNQQPSQRKRRRLHLVLHHCIHEVGDAPIVHAAAVTSSLTAWWLINWQIIVL